MGAINEAGRVKTMTVSLDAALSGLRVAQQALDTVELSVGETESTVEGLLGDRAQEAMVAAL